MALIRASSLPFQTQPDIREFVAFDRYHVTASVTAPAAVILPLLLLRLLLPLLLLLLLIRWPGWPWKFEFLDFRFSGGLGNLQIIDFRHSGGGLEILSFLIFVS